MKVLPVLVAGLLVWTCSSRERTNPLDPRNPVTGGAPTGFHAIANRDTAFLTWNPVDVSGLAGYHIFRSIGLQPLALHTQVTPEHHQFMEIGLSYDSIYCYAIQAVTYAGESLLSKPDTLIPGPSNFWIADFYGSRVWRISYDGAHILGNEYFSSPEALITRPQEGIVWIGDYYEKAVYGVTVQFEVLHRLALTGRPIDVALDPATGTLFVLQRLPDRVLIISPNGNLQDSLEVPGDIRPNAALTLDAGRGRLWLSIPHQSYIGGRIYYLNVPYADNHWQLVSEVAYPYGITANSTTGDCWAATDSGIVHFSPPSDTTVYLSNLRIEDLSLNQANGDCYFVGYNRLAGHWQVGRISGSEVAIILDHSTYLADIQVLSGAVTAGFLVSQIYTGSILRMNAEGQLLGRLDGFYNILEFALE